MTTRSNSSDYSDLPSSRKAAVSEGSKLYFTGAECVHGHVAPRWASNNRCYECARISCREQYRADPEHGRKRVREYAWRDRQAWLAKQTANRRAHRDEFLAVEPFSCETDAETWRVAFCLHELTAHTLRELLEYRPETGEFFWRAKVGRVSPGDPAGAREGGYSSIRVANQSHYAHRLAWLYMTGEWPDKLVDHIDRNPANNRWNNLRLASSTENISNSRIPKNNTSGLKGAYWSEARRCWFSTAKSLDGKSVYLGSYPTKEAAHEAYMAFTRAKVGEFACAG